MPTASADSLQALEERIATHRSRSRDFLHGQQSRLAALEVKLLGDLEEIVARMDQWRQFTQQAEQRQIEFSQEQQELDQQRIALEQRSSELDRQQLEIEEKRRRIAEKLNRQRREQVNARGEKAQELGRKIEQFQDELTTLRDQAHQSLAERDELQSELEQLALQKKQLENDYRSARDSLVASRNDEKDLRQQNAHNRKLLNDRAQQLNQLRDQLEEALRRGEQGESQTAAVAEDLVRLQQERDELHERTIELSLQLEQHSLADASGADYEDLRRQFEMAVENVRELKQRNEELEVALNEKQPLRSAKSASSPFDWETQKAQMLHDLDGDDSLDPEDRISIENAIRLTDSIVEEKDKELASLRSLVAQRETVEEVVVVPPSNEEIDNDARIMQERERLRLLQEEWREKLRAAEVEIAVERAKNARARASIEEQMRDLEQQANMLAKLEKGRGTGRRWMDHLGLNRKDDEEE